MTITEIKRWTTVAYTQTNYWDDEKEIMVRKCKCPNCSQTEMVDDTKRAFKCSKCGEILRVCE